MYLINCNQCTIASHNAHERFTAHVAYATCPCNHYRCLCNFSRTNHRCMATKLTQTTPNRHHNTNQWVLPMQHTLVHLFLKLVNGKRKAHLHSPHALLIYTEQSALLTSPPTHTPPPQLATSVSYHFTQSHMPRHTSPTACQTNVSTYALLAQANSRKCKV